MWRRLPLLGLACLLAIPLVRFAILEANEREVDRTTATWKAREALIARAQVLGPAPSLPAPADLAYVAPEFTCTFSPKAAKATTPKFDCELPDGSTVKVKYGRSRERQAEVAASRLLTMLGFGANHVAIVERVHCLGCPPWPFQTRILAEQFLLTPLYRKLIDHDTPRDFVEVSVERKLAGRSIEVDTFEGWDWRELPLIDPLKGGATRAELDALRLISVFIAHWDNKNPNQRLVCAGDDADGHSPHDPCAAPLLMLQDLGATFGPTKVSFERWSASAIWKDAPGCMVSMEEMPYEGVLFPPTAISEGGRALLAERLRMLTEAHVLSLFQGARFPDPKTGDTPASDLSPWVHVFMKKVQEIANRAPCPSLP